MQPDSAPACFGLGLALLDVGDLAAAREALQRVLSIDPRHAAAHFNLGSIARRQGDLATAERCLQASLALRPTHVPSLVHLGLVLLRRERFEDAARCLSTALSLQPDQPEVRGRLGAALFSMGRIRDSLAHLEAAFAKGGGDEYLVNALAMARLALGEPEEALAVLRQGVARFPGSPGMHSNVLALLHFVPGVTAEAMFDEHLAWAARHAAAIVPAASHDLDPDPDRRLRVGLVTAHVTQGPVPSVLAPLLANHDPAALSFVMYANGEEAEDVATERLRPHTAAWRTIAGLPDDEVAGAVRADRIDVLIDLAGHTGGNRLLVFARKPAPVQATWLDYFDTTGLQSIDYVISDPLHTPEGLPQRFIERVLRVPDCRLCFRPPAEDVPVAPLPALRTGTLTFGSFNRLEKTNRQVVAAWAAILRALPESRLVLKAREYVDAGARDVVRARFAAAGIDPGRIDVRRPSSHVELLAEYADVDLALDTFPHNGGATTLDALWMGVPTLTVAGSTMIARQTHAMQSVCGLGEFSVAQPDELVPLALHWAERVEELAKLRPTLRERVARSPLCDGPRFARSMESAIRTMWRDWCAKRIAGVRASVR